MKGKHALVTGGARGLGRAAALELAARGADVAVADRKLEQAEETAAECRALGVGAVAVALDQADPDSAAACVAQSAGALGGVDLVFANAGTGKFKPFIDMTPQEWRLIMDVNLNGTFYVCQAAARQMIRQGTGGAMVLTASSGAQVLADQLSAYCTSKAGVVMMMKHMASELGSYRIRANAIMPGVVETGMTGPMLQEPRWRSMLLRETPVGRWGQAEDVAKLVAFLLSDDAGYINGESIMIDGGSTLHGFPRWYALDYSKVNQADWEERFSDYPYQPAVDEEER